MTIYVWGPRDKSPQGIEVINTTSRSLNWSRGLSPFFLGPTRVYDDYVSANVENGWQYTKVYQEYADNFGNPTQRYFDWAIAGWSNEYAVRYPMGKGKKPLYSLFKGERLTYVEARAKIYVPMYSGAVIQTEAYTQLVSIYKSQPDLHLWDFDGYNRHALNMTLDEVLKDPNKKMGHAFVLAALLERGVDAQVN